MAYGRAPYRRPGSRRRGYRRSGSGFKTPAIKRLYQACVRRAPKRRVRGKSRTSPQALARCKTYVAKVAERYTRMKSRPAKSSGPSILNWSIR
jgi:hypothetical protein